MPDDRDDIVVGHELLGRRNRLRRIALVIERNELKAKPGQDRPLVVRMFDGQDRTVQHVLAVRGLIAGERRDEANLYHRLVLGATTDCSKQ